MKRTHNIGTTFTLLEYNKDEDAMDVTPYFQKDDESFGLDLNYGNNGDGTWYFRREKKMFSKPWIVGSPNIK